MFPPINRSNAMKARIRILLYVIASIIKDRNDGLVSRIREAGF